MSPSSTEPRALAAGLFVGRDAVSFTLLGADAGGKAVASTRSVPLDSSIYRGLPQPAARKSLADAIATCTAEIRGRHLPLHIVVPDAAAGAATFELDQVPGDRSALDRLVEHRLSRELGAPAGACVSQLLGESGGKHLLLGVSLDRAWLAALTEACRSAGVVPWSLRTAATVVFNDLQPAVRQEGGALVTVTADAWALWVWDGGYRARPLRSQWRASANDEREIAAEVERALIAYTDAHPTCGITRLHVWSVGNGAALAELLDQRTQSSCLRHTWPESVAGAETCERSATLAVSLMAALAT